MSTRWSATSCPWSWSSATTAPGALRSTRCASSTATTSRPTCGPRPATTRSSGPSVAPGQRSPDRMRSARPSAGPSTRTSPTWSTCAAIRRSATPGRRPASDAPSPTSRRTGRLPTMIDVGRREDHRTGVRALPSAEWIPYLRRNSGLPGPRANLELAQAVADEGDETMFETLLSSDEEYLVMCGAIGLGRLLVDGAGAEPQVRLRSLAADRRWRVREGVAMALQRLGDADMAGLHDLVSRWAADPDPLVQRAAVAGLCEPRLLREPADAARAVELCSRITDSLAARPPDERRSDGVRALRKALGYCWSVAVAADPPNGLPGFLALSRSGDPDVAWIVREIAKKARLTAVLPD